MTLPPHDVADLGLAAEGAARIAWSDRAMPVLRALRERFAEDRPLAGRRVAACLHVTAETAGLVRALVAGGAEVSLCASNPLSTQDDVAAALVVDHGVRVHARRGVGPQEYAAHVDAALDLRPDLVLDDGVDLTVRLHGGRRELLAGVRAGCEDTPTGVLRLRALAAAGALAYPVVALSDTPVKRLVDHRHGTAQSTIDALLRATHALLAGRVVVVAGYGPAGQGVAERARGLGARVVVTEVDPARALAAHLDGLAVLPMEDALPLADVVVTVTGNRDVVAARHLPLLRDGAVLLNAGHFDVEIDVQALASAAADVRRGVRPGVDEYVLDGGRRVLLLAEGRVANLGIAEGNPPAVMDIAFAEQALTLAALATGPPPPPGVHPVPEQALQQVAALTLTALGVRIDALTEAQVAYLDVWERT